MELNLSLNIVFMISAKFCSGTVFVSFYFFMKVEIKILIF